jgi:hypothetical protein
MKLTLPIVVVLYSLAGGLAAHAQASISCVPLYEARQQNKSLEPEFRTAIVNTVRRLAQERKLLWQRPLGVGCVDLACMADEEIVTQVIAECAGNPFQTLESAATSLTPRFEHHGSGLY